MIDDSEEEAGGGGGAAWMATFADMMTLLLTFFVLLLSFASMDVVKFRDAMGSVQNALGVAWKHEGTFEAVATTPIQIFDEEERPQAVIEDLALLEELRRAIALEGLEDDIHAELVARGVLLRIDGRVLYEQGAATLRPAAESPLGRFVDLALESDHQLMIEGHTDDLPIQTTQFPSNWELSTARAIAAMRFVVDRGVAPSRVAVAGYADLRPLEPNDTADHRALNRRVEFVFISEDPVVADAPGPPTELVAASAVSDTVMTMSADGP